MNPSRLTLRHIIIKIERIEEKIILKVARERKLLTFKGGPIRLLADF